MMAALIQQVMEAAGDMPDPAAHRRYLGTLDEEALWDRLKTLTAEAPRHREPKIKFWTRAVKIASADEQTYLPLEGERPLTSSPANAGF